MFEVIVENETHTLACLIRPNLFKCGADFGACVVEHPQQKFLKILIDSASKSPVKVLEDSLKQSRTTLESMLRDINYFETNHT